MRILIGTRKGLFRLEKRAAGWRLDEPQFLGTPVTCALRDPRDGSIWAALAHAHWGPKLHRSSGSLDKFEEVGCPAFPQGIGASVRRIHVLSPEGPEGSLFAGTDPGGLFATRDGGSRWSLNEALWRLRAEDGWFPGGGGLMLHSVDVEAAKPDRMYVGVSCAGVYATEDGGQSWEPRNRGIPAPDLPDAHPEVGQDTHRLLVHPSDPRLLWQQNHCGCYRSLDGGRTWRDISGGLPSRFGFALALDESDRGVAWTVPVQSETRRIAPSGAFLVCRTENGGETWTEFRNGLPQTHFYDIVLRHGLDAASGVLVLGTNCGRLFLSEDRGERWRLVQAGLPPINSVRIER